MGNNQTSITKRGNTLEFQSQPFDQGSIRYAFKARIIKGPGKGDKGVIKVFKNAPMRSSFVSTKKEMETYDVANKYAKDYCQQLRQIGQNYSIHFPQPDLVKIKSLNFFTWLKSDYFSGSDFVIVQQYLKGKYQKFTNNAGFSSNDQVMDAFQHYTYVKSDKYAICCDLQGVLTGNKYYLTDPAVNSIDQSFGNTDMGKKGIQYILSQHKCNSICKKMDLQINGKYDPSVKPVIISATQRRSHTYGI